MCKCEGSDKEHIKGDEEHEESFGDFALVLLVLRLPDVLTGKMKR